MAKRKKAIDDTKGLHVVNNPDSFEKTRHQVTMEELMKLAPTLKKLADYDKAKGL